MNHVLETFDRRGSVSGSESGSSTIGIQRVAQEIRDLQEDEGIIDFGAFEDHLFDILSKRSGKVMIPKLRKDIKEMGLVEDDPRLVCLFKTMNQIERRLKKEKKELILDRGAFKSCVSENLALLKKGFEGELVIPDFPSFSKTIELIYQKCRPTTAGKVADYLPQLKRMDPSTWGIAVCTVDGQRLSFGDATKPFPLQACFKPLLYALALSDLGDDLVHQYVGLEPSGDHKDQIRLGPNGKPHNAIINAGALVTVSLIKAELQLADRFDYIQNVLKEMCGRLYLNYNNGVYLSERESANRNFALSHYLKEMNCFPKGTTVSDVMDLYCQMCSVEVTCQSASVMAATLANAGNCPLTGRSVLGDESVRGTLALMHSCGMYDYSGQFAFDVGLPAKSSVTGAILVVIPNLLGMCLWSPPLDSYGNSCRGMDFLKEFERGFCVHSYDNIMHLSTKINPWSRVLDCKTELEIYCLLDYAMNGNLKKLQKMFLKGLDMRVSDYDSRTALHLACAEGHLDCVKFLLETCHVPHSPVDRWSHTPLSEAKNASQDEVYMYLEEYIKRHPETPRSSVSSQALSKSSPMIAEASGGRGLKGSTSAACVLSFASTDSTTLTRQTSESAVPRSSQFDTTLTDGEGTMPDVFEDKSVAMNTQATDQSIVKETGDGT